MPKVCKLCSLSSIPFKINLRICPRLSALLTLPNIGKSKRSLPNTSLGQDCCKCANALAYFLSFDDGGKSLQHFFEISFVYKYTDTCIHTNIYTNTHTGIHTSIYNNIYTCIHTFLHKHKSLNTCRCM
jgi:hypothetical protein